MKKFSFLLLGAFLLWTITFALAEESRDANQLTGSLVAEPTLVAAQEVATWDTAEVATWDTAEVATWDTAEVTTWDTAEATTWDTAEATTWDTAEVTTWDTAETTETLEPTENTEEVASTISDAAKEKYGEEQIAAYEWALENGITTINDVEKARLTDGLTRAELAKMMSQYMTKVLWRTPATGEKANYADVDSSLGDLADFIETAYAYKIMWINADGTPLKEFNPKGKVTRAEYATVFSRVLFWDKYNKSEWNYYENHINALKDAKILTTTTPTIQEVRGWVMLMMYRSSQNSDAIEKVANATVAEEATTEEPTAEEPTNVEEATTTEESTGTIVWMANPASVYCIEQGWESIIKEDEEWNQYWVCKLADGNEVEEWEYYRANHSENETWATTEEPTTEEATTEEPATEENTVEAWTGEVATTEISDK